VEHRFEEALKEAAGGRAHALVLNYERHLTTVFGDDDSLAHRLRFPLFVESITAPDRQPTLAATRALKAAKTVLSKFDAGLDSDVLDDTRYDYRVRLIPTTSSKMSADAAYEFVNLDKVTDEERRTLTDAGRTGTVLTKLKAISVAGKDTMLPKAVVAAVQARVPFEFNVTLHTILWKHFKVHPSPWQPPEGGQTDQKYCVAFQASKQYVFTPAWVDKIVREVGTLEKYEAFFGRPPKKGKVTQIQEARGRKPLGKAGAQQTG
jgi:hypothetical protein